MHHINKSNLSQTVLGALFFLFALFASELVQAQRGFDPKAMAAREKSILVKRIDGLTEDQLMLMDGIYEEYGDSFVELRNEIRKTRNWEEMRIRMQALREEKTLLMMDLLNPTQFEVYAELMEQQEKQFKERQGQRPNNPPDNNP